MPDSSRHPFFVDAPLVLAHRGASAYAPDHTLTAIRAALDRGAHAIEVDVHLTRDGHPVLHHSGEVSENTNGRGRIQSMTLAEVRSLDAGYRWTADGGTTFPYRGQGERIATLGEALRAFPTARFNVDIKSRRAARPVREAIERADAADRVLLASWYSWRRAPALDGYTGPRSITLDQMLRFMLLYWTRLDSVWWPRVDAFQVPERYYGIPVVSRRLVERVRRRGIEFHVWTVDAFSDMMRLLEWGATGLVTNRPDVAMNARTRYLAERSS